MGLEEIHGLCCRFLLSADGDVVARLTESVCVTFRNGGRRAVGRNHFTPSSRESGSNIDNYTNFLNITHARTARSSPAFTASCRNWLWGERTGDTPRSFRWCAKSSREPWQLRELDAQLSFPWTHDVTSVAKTAGGELYASVSNSYITDFLRYRSRERRRRALIHGLQEEGEPCGQAKRIHLHQGCNLKILTTPSSSSSLVTDSFATRSIRQTGRIWAGGRQGRRRPKAITSDQFDPIANLEQAGDRDSGITGGFWSEEHVRLKRSKQRGYFETVGRLICAVKQ